MTWRLYPEPMASSQSERSSAPTRLAAASSQTTSHVGLLVCRDRLEARGRCAIVRICRQGEQVRLARALLGAGGDRDDLVCVRIGASDGGGANTLHHLDTRPHGPRVPNGDSPTPAKGERKRDRCRDDAPAVVHLPSMACDSVAN